MAAFCLRHSLSTINPLINLAKPSTKRKPVFSPCRSHLPPPPPPPENEERKESARRSWTPAKIYREARKLTKELKETLSPRQKGDWKDVVLMSFSFAVYVYISQRIVSAYCAWISTAYNHC